jgi:hypothetical protein
MHVNAIAMIPGVAPMWVAYVVGIVTGIYYLRRRRVQAAMVLGASATALLLSLAGIVRVHWLFTAIAAGVEPAKAGMMSGFTASFLPQGTQSASLYWSGQCFGPMRHRSGRAIEVSRIENLMVNRVGA